MRPLCLSSGLLGLLAAVQVPSSFATPISMTTVLPMAMGGPMTLGFVGPTAIPDMQGGGAMMPAMGSLMGMLKRSWFHEADYGVSPDSTVNDRLFAEPTTTTNGQLFAEPTATPDEAISKRSNRKKTGGSRKKHSSQKNSEQDLQNDDQAAANPQTPAAVHPLNIAANNAGGPSLPVASMVALPGGMDFGSPIRMASGAMTSAAGSRNSLAQANNKAVSMAFHGMQDSAASDTDTVDSSDTTVSSSTTRREWNPDASGSDSVYEKRHSLVFSTLPILPNQDDNPDRSMTQEEIDQNHQMGFVNIDSNARPTPPKSLSDVSSVKKHSVSFADAVSDDIPGGSKVSSAASETDTSGNLAPAISAVPTADTSKDLTSATDTTANVDDVSSLKPATGGVPTSAPSKDIKAATDVAPSVNASKDI